MGEKLYSNRLYAIRECIQNSLDSIKIISTKVKEGHYIYLKYYVTNSPILEIFDSGTGMNLDIFRENFLSIGSNSFWYSEKGIEEWDIDFKSLDLIADHGIGTLSYFMIADQLEIITKYQKSIDFLHIKIDDFKDSILCKKTVISDFPRFSTAENLSTPWDLMHGTCIRFFLNSPLEFYPLLEFLSTNILRCPTKLLLNYNSVEY